MKKLLLFSALGLAAWYAWRKWLRPQSALDAHLEEQSNLQRIGEITTAQSLDAKPYDSYLATLGLPWIGGSILVPGVGGAPSDRLNGIYRNAWGLPIPILN